MWRLVARELTPGTVEVHLDRRWHRVIDVRPTEHGDIALELRRGEIVLAPTAIVAARPAT